MKKSIVLLITMLFISAISLLVMDNLKDSDKFITNSQNSANFTQTNISIKNINDVLIKQINKVNDDELDELFSYVELLNSKSIGNVYISNLSPEILDISSFYNIKQDYTNTSDIYLIENIDYRYDLYSISKDKNITNKRQLEYVVNEYINLTKDEKILNVLNSDKFLANYDKYKEGNSSRTFISCNYDIQVNNMKSHIDMTFEHKKDAPIYFDYYTIGNNIE